MSERRVANVTVLGPGRMGSAMIDKLVQAGHAVTVWGRRDEHAALIASELGAEAVATLGEAAARSEFVLATLADGQVSQQVLLDDGFLANLSADALVCDMATTGPSAVEVIAEGLAARDVDFLDAPVSGSVPTVLAGNLLVMVGGSEADVARITPILQAFARSVRLVGPVGAGQAMKLAVNLIVFSLNSAVAEGLAIAQKSGIDPQVAYDVFENSVVAAPLVNYKRAAFLDPSVPVAMSLSLSGKDLDLITDLAEQCGVPVGVARAVSDQIANACAAGFGGQDMAALARFLEGNAPE